MVTMMTMMTIVSDEYEKDTMMIRMMMMIVMLIIVIVTILIPIVVTLVGIVTDVSDVHDQKAYWPGDRIWLGIVIVDVSLMVVMMTRMIIPIEVVAPLKVIEHGDDVQSSQQPVPSALLHVTSSS